MPEPDMTSTRIASYQSNLHSCALRGINRSDSRDPMANTNNRMLSHLSAFWLIPERHAERSDRVPWHSGDGSDILGASTMPPTTCRCIAILLGLALSLGAQI